MNTLHIFRKEMRNYFNSTIAYVFFAFFLLIVGYTFLVSMFRYAEMSMFAQQNMQMMQNMNPRDGIITPLFMLMTFLFIFLIPVITMTLFSEERKLGTVELLFTYPITEFQLTMGKFLASVAVVIILLIFSFTYVFLYRQYFSATPWSFIWTQYLGIFLVSLAFVAFGMWVSSLTSDQATSALGTVGGLLVFWIIGSAKMVLTGKAGEILAQFSILEHFQNFAKGVIDTHDLVFFFLFIFLFIFLTMQVLETRKWKGYLSGQ